MGGRSSFGCGVDGCTIVVVFGGRGDDDGCGGGGGGVGNGKVKQCIHSSDIAK